VVQAIFPSLVVWASLWPDRPDDQIRFDIEDQRFTWTLMGEASAAAEERLAQLRYRLDVMINADLRISKSNHHPSRPQDDRDQRDPRVLSCRRPGDTRGGRRARRLASRSGVVSWWLTTG
jgi:hypothetical protein